MLEQLEEGEILDDELEAISDDSIVEVFGKSVSPKERLRALSLSSISDNDTRQSKRKYKRTCKRRHKQKRRTPSTDESDSDATIEYDRERFKEAIQIGRETKIQCNPLKMRLKVMERPTKDDDDADLEALRLEALKTAIINKCQRRKKRKLLESLEKDQTPSENKENNVETTPVLTVDDNANKHPCNEQNLDTSMEEDEDVLRASLLATISKKITKDVPKTPIISTPKPNITKITTSNRVINRIQKTIVQPLIININDDSESDENPKENTGKNLDTISNTVDRFLKEQRAKFELQTKKHVEKSALKLLPKSQQLEYQRLLRRLQLAEKKKENTPNNGKTVKTESDFALFEKTLKDVQVRDENGRLQISSKYQVLVSIVKEINRVSNETKQHQTHIKKLLEDMAEAKKHLSKSHEEFSALIKELVNKKQNVDRTLTIKKLNTDVTPNVVPQKNGDEARDDVEIMDPNDVDRIINIQNGVKCDYSKYESPLNNIERMNVDPLGIMCPYEVDGSCRDADCTFTHYLKTNNQFHTLP